MISLPSLEEMLVKDSAPVREAVAVIDRNAQGLCFVLDIQGRLVGTASDGDIRRGLLAGIRLDDPVRRVTRIPAVRMPYQAAPEAIQAQLSPAISHIPLVDHEDRPVDYACQHRIHRIPVLEPIFRGRELEYVTDCIRSTWISSQGSYIGKFEEAVAGYVGVPYGIAVCNGTSALHLALEALGIGLGDEVILPDYTFAASINAVIYTGATPVLVDVRADNWTIDLDRAEDLITSRTKAMMPVHIYGHPCDIDGFVSLANRYDLFVVEDCAEALGSTMGGRPVGTFGDAAAFSFFGNKTVTTGEGGMVLVKTPELDEKVRILRDHGMSRQRKYWHDVVGFNYRMTNLQAAVGAAQMERIDEIVAGKARVGRRYRELLPEGCGIRQQHVAEGVEMVEWLKTVLVEGTGVGLDRNELADKLLRNGIETRPAFWPLHQMPPYVGFGGGRDFPVSDYIGAHGLSLPSSVSLGDADVEHICRIVDSVIGIRKLREQN